MTATRDRVHELVDASPEKGPPEPVRLPRLTGRQVLAALRRGGWEHVRTSGSHHHLRHADRAGLVTVPVHGGEIIYPKFLKSILRQADLSADEFQELLR